MFNRHLLEWILTFPSILLYRIINYIIRHKVLIIEPDFNLHTGSNHANKSPCIVPWIYFNTLSNNNSYLSVDVYQYHIFGHNNAHIVHR